MAPKYHLARSLWFEKRCSAGLRQERIGSLADDEVRVRALFSLISQGSELNLYRGEGSLPALRPPYEGVLPFPVKFGYQVVGRVEEAGIRSGASPGDLVFARHPHQDYFNISMHNGFAHRLPTGADPRKAAFIGMCTVALQTLLEVPVRIGDCVVVSGLGLVGTFAAYLARKTADILIIIDPLESRRRAAEWIGADLVLTPEEAVGEIERITRGRGVDIYVETSGAASALQAAIDTTGDLGTIAVPAWYGTRQVSLSLSPQFHLRAQRIVSIHVGKMGGDLAARWSRQRRVDVAMSIMEAIDPDKLITHIIPFDRAPEAYQILDERSHDALGVLIEYPDAPSNDGAPHKPAA